EADLAPIVAIQVDHVRRRLAERRIGLVVTDAALAHLAKLGYDPAFGARPLKRVIQREVSDRLASEILSGHIADGDSVTVDLEGDELVVRVSRPDEPAGP